jgi:hypothetical protein
MMAGLFVHRMLNTPPIAVGAVMFHVGVFLVWILGGVIIYIMYAGQTSMEIQEIGAKITSYSY